MNIKSKRHKWSVRTKSKAKDNSSVACVKCGCIRQYVGGIPTYFINDSVYDKYAPDCLPNYETL